LKALSCQIIKNKYKKSKFNGTGLENEKENQKPWNMKNPGL